MEQGLFIDEKNYECNISCFYLQLAGMFQFYGGVTQSDGAELKTDGVQAFQKSVSAYKRAGSPSQVNVQCLKKSL